MYSKRNKTLVLTGAVNDEMFKTLMRSIDQTPSTILINTEGGELYAALAIYDLIRSELPKVTIIACGACMSAGMIIMQAGFKRVAYENAQIMVHYGEDSNTSVGELKHNIHLSEIHAQILAKRSFVPVKKIKTAWFVRDTYMTAEQALNYGLLDYVLEIK